MLIVKTRLFALTLLLLAFSLTPLGAAQALPNTAQGVLLAYYTDINLKDYASAYQLWQNPPQTYQSFAGGFSLTDKVEPYLGALQSHNLAGEMGRVPVVLLGYNTNGTISSYYGCFRLSTANRISGATIRLISNNGVPDGLTITNLMAIDCFNLPQVVTTTFQDVSSPAYGLLWSYFRAINQRDYSTAYADWLQPIPGPKPNGQPAQDYRQPYTQFVSGYSDTTWINVYPGAYNQTGASAGHSYLDGLMPVVLVGQRTNGAVTAYYGCFVVGAFPNGSFGIVSGRFIPFLNDIPTGDQIVAHEPTDCTSLNLRY